MSFQQEFRDALTTKLQSMLKEDLVFFFFFFFSFFVLMSGTLVHWKSFFLVSYMSLLLAELGSLQSLVVNALELPYIVLSFVLAGSLSFLQKR